MPPAFGGIDFGTSNSTVGIVADGRPQLVALEGADTTLPSAVFFNFEDNRTYFGRRAIADYTDNAEGRLLRALKSVLGSSLIHEKTRIKARSVAFSDIIGEFIGFLKTGSTRRCSETVERRRARAAGAFRRRRRDGRRRGAGRAREGGPRARASSISTSSTSRSPRRSTTSSRCSARNWR